MMRFPGLLSIPIGRRKEEKHSKGSGEGSWPDDLLLILSSRHFDRSWRIEWGHCYWIQDKDNIKARAVMRVLQVGVTVLALYALIWINATVPRVSAALECTAVYDVEERFHCSLACAVSNESARPSANSSIPCSYLAWKASSDIHQTASFCIRGLLLRSIGTGNALWFYWQDVSGLWTPALKVSRAFMNNQNLSIKLPLTAVPQ